MSRDGVTPLKLFSEFAVDAELKGALLGRGRSAAVKEVTISGAKCTAKIILAKMSKSANSGAESSTSRDAVVGKLVRGCGIWASLHHPNIAPFLGTVSFPDSPIPALLTEYFPINLHCFLKQAHIPHSIPLSLKILILQNVACGLAYLHGQSSPISHGHLSAKKIFLDSGAVAKISVDVGVTVLPKPLELSPYMPPEVTDEHSSITTTVDVFSFGVLALFTLTHCLPETLLQLTYTDESNQPVHRTEIERRAQAMEKMTTELGKQNALIKMITNCLSQEPNSRPTIVNTQHLLWQASVLVPDPFQDKTKLEVVRDMTALSRKYMRMREEFEKHDRELRDHIRALLQGMARQRKLLPHENNSDEDEDTVTEQEIAYISNFVEGIQAVWLGRELGVSESALDIIERNPSNRRDENKKRGQVLTDWVRNTESSTWTALVDALSSIGQKRVSEILQNDKGI